MTNLIATENTTSSVVLSWGPSPAAVYSLALANVSNGAIISNTTFTATGYSTVVSNLLAGVEYQFTIYSGNSYSVDYSQGATVTFTSVFCLGATLNNALWPSNTPAGSSGSGICIVGTAGQPYALCSQSVGQGVWGTFTGSCSSCASNTYQDQTGQPQCKSCPANSGSPPGSNSSSQCACLTGYTLVNATCQGRVPLISSYGSWRNQHPLIYLV